LRTETAVAQQEELQEEGVPAATREVTQGVVTAREVLPAAIPEETKAATANFF
jgi:hypothetical protein